MEATLENELINDYDRDRVMMMMIQPTSMFIWILFPKKMINGWQYFKIFKKRRRRHEQTNERNERQDKMYTRERLGCTPLQWGLSTPSLSYNDDLVFDQ